MSSKEKVIKNNQSLVPFFGERMEFIRGLDPLGLQNTSDATFSMLLPGLNNVTGRVRYYSFYCWLLDEYSMRIGSTAPEVQRKFIRTAEYIIALSSQYCEDGNGSIPGSNYANVQVNSEKKVVHDLNAGIYKPDGTTANTYWNYSWGAFGQYYLGSIRDIGIIIDRESNGGVYARTNSIEQSFVSGEMLAKAFDNNVLNKKELFFECLDKGIVSEDQLKSLIPEFDLTKVPEDTVEQELLSRLIVQKDYPLRIEEESATLRKKTIYHLLKFIQTEPEKFNDREFVYGAYLSKGKSNGILDISLMGWYYYQFNEFWHFANTSIFNGALDYLENNHGPNWVAVNEFVENLSTEIIQSFLADDLLVNTTDTLQDLLDRIADSEFDFLLQIKDTSKVARVKVGFLILFSQNRSNIEDLLMLKEFGESNELAKEGEGAGYFLLQFKNKMNSPFKSFIRDYIYKNIIYRHQYVAFRKIRGGSLSTQKFIIEDQHIRYLGNFEAGFTGPRIGSLISFLKDLRVISKENQLTDFGLDLLTQITPTND